MAKKKENKSYNERVDETWKIVKPMFADKLATLAKDLGINPESWEETGGEEYTLHVGGEICGKKFDIEAMLAEELATEGEGDRFSIAVRAVEWGGRVLDDYVPYNYSPRLWTRNIRELEARIDEFDPHDMAEYIRNELAEPPRCGQE